MRSRPNSGLRAYPMGLQRRAASSSLQGGLATHFEGADSTMRRIRPHTAVAAPSMMAAAGKNNIGCCRRLNLESTETPKRSLSAAGRFVASGASENEPALVSTPQQGRSEGRHAVALHATR